MSRFPLFTDIIDKSELKAFFESNSSQIYFIFYENFITLESNLKQKGTYTCINYTLVYMFNIIIEGGSVINQLNGMPKPTVCV